MSDIADDVTILLVRELEGFKRELPKRSGFAADDVIINLVETRKENWSFAPYPVENHGFEEETSWADEYKRILKLFDDNLKKPRAES